jgi:hypothetical protein
MVQAYVRAVFLMLGAAELLRRPFSFRENGTGGRRFF